VKENPESEELDGLLCSSSFVVTISVCLSKSKNFIFQINKIKI